MEKQKHPIRIVGHRGAHYRAPENSLASFKACLDNTIDGIECDVHITKDNIPIIIHDETLDRTTNGTGRVDIFTLEELQSFSIIDKGHSTQPIPTLKDLLDLISSYSYNSLLNIEIKSENTALPVLAVLAQYPQLFNYTLISSFRLEELPIIANNNPTVRIGLLFNDVDDVDFEAMQVNYHPHSIHLPLPYYTTKIGKQLIEFAQHHKLELAGWTPEELSYPLNMSVINQAIEQGISIIITDYPVEVQEALLPPLNQPSESP